MRQAFPTVWSGIQRRLRPGASGTELRSWSADSGYTGGIFQVVAVALDSITVDSESLSSPRQIPKREFERIYQSWPQYLSGDRKRSDLRHESKNLTYIFSVLHWRESN